jgi:hypothetical protein
MSRAIFGLSFLKQKWLKQVRIFNTHRRGENIFKASSITTVTNTASEGYDGRTPENKMDAPARTHKTTAKKIVNNIMNTITESTYILKALTKCIIHYRKKTHAIARNTALQYAAVSLSEWTPEVGQLGRIV